MISGERASTVRVLVAEPISEAGLDLLRSSPGFEVTVRTGMSREELAGAVGTHEALIVRSATRVTKEVLKDPGRLRVIGRAGAGVDNIDLDAATRRGVVVINTPGGNSVAAAEHTLSLLLALARNVAQANADLRAGRWERSKHVGVEVAGKRLGIIGLGRIGREVAHRARALRMEVLAYDPYVSEKTAEALGVAFRPLDELLAESDFVTLHVPLSAETKAMVDAGALARMKPGARLINCARGGLVDEDALLEAVDSGHLAGAALDVFEVEPPRNRRLTQHPRILATPHLGASTVEAQERIGVEIAEKVLEFFRSGIILDAVNFPSIGREGYSALRPVMDLAERLGRFLAQIVEGGSSRFEVRCYGGFTEHPLKPVVMAATKGLLSPVLEGGVSYVNALALATERGITVEEARSNETTPFAGLLRLTLETDRDRASVAGTLFTAEHPRLVEIDGVPIESSPSGHLLFFRNRDVPGVVGRIGTILGGARVNIAGIQLGRADAGGKAVSIINVDSPVPPEALAQIRDLEDILMVRALEV